MLSPQDLTALWITLKLAVISTAILIVLCVPLAWWLAQTRSRAKTFVEAAVSLPLVLPPTVVGFYLLLLLGPRGAIGGFLEEIGVGHLAFSFSGLVIGSMIYSLPFVVQPLQNAFQATGTRVLEAAATLRAGPLDRFLSVSLPLARRGFLTAAVLSFARRRMSSRPGSFASIRCMTLCMALAKALRSASFARKPVTPSLIRYLAPYWRS